MKHLTTFEGFEWKNLFKSKKQKQAEEMFGTKDLSREEEFTSTNIMIDCEPYDVSQFNQKKFGVYIENPKSTIYIGDLRQSSTGGYISYLNIERFKIKKPENTVCHPNKEQMEIINAELNKNYLSRDLMDETITFREYLKQNGINL